MLPYLGYIANILIMDLISLSLNDITKQAFYYQITGIFATHGDGPLSPVQIPSRILLLFWRPMTTHRSPAVA